MTDGVKRSGSVETLEPVITRTNQHSRILYTFDYNRHILDHDEPYTIFTAGTIQMQTQTAVDRLPAMRSICVKKQQKFSLAEWLKVSLSIQEHLMALFTGQTVCAIIKPANRK